MSDVARTGLFLASIAVAGLGCGVGVVGDNSGVEGDETNETIRTVKTAVIRGVTFADRCVQIEEVDGEAVFEGDILLGKVADIVRPCTVGATVDDAARSRAASSLVLAGSRYRWPDGLVPFVVADDLSAAMKERIASAIEHWQRQTRIRFVRRTSEGSYVHFVPGDDNCSSRVGRVGGRQPIKLSPKCTAINVIHEVGHAVGFWHEQSRADRDQHVTIRWENIEAGRAHNFEQHVTDGTDIGDYDYASRMHYSSHAFSVNGEPTIEAKTPDTVLGNTAGLSEGDIRGVAAIYPDLPLRAPACSACMAGGDCRAACEAAGRGGGQCADPGSADPASCCVCDDGTAPPQRPEPTQPGPTHSNPIGTLDSVDGGLARGWACDTADPAVTIDVHVYVGGPAGSGAKGYPATADRASEPAVLTACGGGTAHRFAFAIPDWTARTGQAVYVYAIGLGDHNPLLAGSPAVLAPQPPAPDKPEPDPDPHPEPDPDPTPDPQPGPTNPTPSAKTPTGVLDSVQAGVARGWACDADKPQASIDVHVYVGGPAGSGAPGFAARADRPSEDAVAAECGGGSAHRFAIAIADWQAKVGQPVYVYAIDLTGGTNPLLASAPKPLQ